MQLTACAPVFLLKFIALQAPMLSPPTDIDLRFPTELKTVLTPALLLQQLLVEARTTWILYI